MHTAEVDGAQVARRKLSMRVLAGRAFMVKTPPCERYLTNLKNWLTYGSQGAIVMGRPRLGKTMATRWTLSQLSSLFGNVPWLEVPVRQQRVASEREFFQHLLHCAHHKHYLEGTAGDRRDRFTAWLNVRACRSSINTFVLFLDEAQDLSEMHYSWLRNIGNELDQRGARLFCLLVGQPELADKKADLVDRNLEQVVGRFMVREMEFPGIGTCEDLKQCFDAFHATMYPANGNLMFPEHFIPRAVAAGFTLGDLAPAVWALFERLWRVARPEEAPSIAMHHVSAALVGILNSLVARDQESLRVSADLIDTCVKRSGYLESLRGKRHKK